MHNIDVNVKTVIDAAGTSKEFIRCLSIVLACWTLNVCCWAYAVIRMIPDAHIGPILITDFSSSTRWTVFSLHRLGDFGLSSSVTIAARSKNLKTKRIKRYSYFMFVYLTT